jgi:negative regulator of flagellin synthesis FlgM
MKIGQMPDIPSSVNPAGPKKTEQAPTPAPAKAVAPAATAGVAVTVSKLARSLGQAEMDPDIDAERVAQVKSAIENGTFKANPEVIADKLLANAQEMLNRVRR